MILELLKKAIKQNDFAPVREAYKLISGKELILSGDINIVKMSGIEIQSGEETKIKKLDDQFVFSRKTKESPIVEKRANKFSPDDYSDIEDAEPTVKENYKPRARKRAKSEKFSLECRICNNKFQSVIQESICPKCVTK